MNRIVIPLCAVVLLAACGGEEPVKEHPIAITGPNGASSLQPAGLWPFGSCTRAGDPVDVNMAVLMFSTAPGICEDLAAAITPSRSTTAFIAVGRIGAVGSSLTIFVPETFTVIPPGAALPPPDARGSAVAFVTVERFGGAPVTGPGCELLGLSTAVSGTVTITEARGDANQTTVAVAGRVDAVLDDGGRVEGTFDVPLCAGASGLLRSDCTPVAIPVDTTCQ